MTSTGLEVATMGELEAHLFILTDADLDPAALMPVAMGAVGSALQARREGRLVAPPRTLVPIGDLGDLVMTIGGATGADAIGGLRIYETFNGRTHSQVTVVWSAIDANLLGIVVGERLGEIRTGAIGGVAIDVMSTPGARTAAIIGTGRQAAMQLLAAARVRHLGHVRVFSRNETSRQAFAERMSALIGVPVEPAETAELAIRDADIVVCATDSMTPVIRADWLKPWAHVNTVGPKTVRAHELDTATAGRAKTIATDSPEQARAYPEPFFLHEALSAGRIADLAAVSARPRTRQPDDITLFCSVGLAGTEVLVAAAIFEALGRR